MFYHKINDFRIFVNIDWNEAQFDTESRMKDEITSISELHYTPRNPRNI